jgi:DNA polymerase I-like protein with 3'-5' exonuclease and polymerase domains
LWEPTEFGLHKALPREQAVLEYGPRLKRAYTYKGLNRLIQGSAADQTKKSMLACIEAGKLPLLQVHDELCLSVTSAEEANKFAQAMMDCVKLEVPSKVDVECGPSWGEAA